MNCVYDYVVFDILLLLVLSLLLYLVSLIMTAFIDKSASKSEVHEIEVRKFWICKYRYVFYVFDTYAPSISPYLCEC